ncbi:MAG: tetratricopeptide repeat protein [Bacteroidetes bacterium]|nr:tetratricopeptide repeat protein [Bacteroidota bacterium]
MRFRNLVQPEEFPYKTATGGLYDSGDYPRALEYYLKSLEIQKSLNDRKGMAGSYNNIGIIYTIRQQYDSAFAVLQKALLIDEELGDKWGMTYSLTGIGDNYIQQGKPLQALPWLERSAAVAEEIGAKPVLMEAYEKLSEAWEALSWESDSRSGSQLGGIQSGKHPPTPLIRGDSLTRADCLAKALEYHKLYSTVRDSVFSEEKTKELGRQEGKYELKMHLAEQKRLKDEQEREAAAQKAYRDTWQNLGMLMGLFFLFSAVFFLGNFVIPDWAVKAASFIPFVLLFEFIFVVADPWIEALTGGQPLYMMLINTGIVFMLFPFQYYFENKLRQRLYKVKKKKAADRKGRRK